jgi:hypothetical protein
VRFTALFLISIPLAVSAEKFVAVWKGEGENGSRMTLRLFNPIPTALSEGWLNSPQGTDAADGDFHAISREPAWLEIKRGPVVFQADRAGKYPAARYSWRDGVLTICMLGFKSRVIDLRDGIATHIDYSTCVTMRKVEK